ncbi:MAG: S41 family peptidase [Bacteroidales bacterium]|nr:S41 family peptidase [Bacteroidales bacterium]
MKYFKGLLISALFVIICSTSYAQINPSYSLNNNKMNQFLRYMNDMYVDTVDFNNLVEKGIIEMMETLDPHSSYIAKKDVQLTSEPLKGEFEGIGVTFQLIKDTINIIEVIINGPSEKVGIMAGDKIVKVDTAVACGPKINNNWVRDHLRGKKGSVVKVWIKRGKSDKLLEFSITRDKIPMYSINVSFMVDDKTGYIRLERFAQTSPREFFDALNKLKAQGMEDLIFDLRGNGGGYLEVAFRIADEFIKGDRIIVYTDNFRKTGERRMSHSGDNFEKGKLIVLVDEYSASASEIVSGAIQDWDRGIIMGRRTFGKGLVQKPIRLNDGSEIRLTISHYYTPTGRCIQKPYTDNDSYSKDLANRYKHGEYLTPDSISFPDSLKFTTPHGKTVYGGGGIMPDIFIPYDTSKYSTFYNELVRKAIVSGYTMDYMSSHRDELKAKYPTIQDFRANFTIDDAMYQDLLSYAKNQGITDTTSFLFSQRMEIFVKNKKEELDSLYRSLSDLQQMDKLDTMIQNFITESYNESVKLKNMDKAPEFIKEYLSFEIARNLYSYGDAYQIILMNDETFQQACKTMHDNKMFKRLKISD